MEQFFTYVLYSERYYKIYIGYTSNLNDRLISHNEKAQKGWTIKFRPWRILCYETFSTKTEAMKREKELKSSRGRYFIRTKIT
jgi:putative endonuclease